MITPSDLELRLRECERRIEEYDWKIRRLAAQIGLLLQQVVTLRQAPFD